MAPKPDENEKLGSWYYESLTRAGLNPIAAQGITERLLENKMVDYRLVLRMLRQGCDPATLTDILF